MVDTEIGDGILSVAVIKVAETEVNVIDMSVELLIVLQFENLDIFIDFLGRPQVFVR